jgi:hypothetical protein
MLTMSPAVDIGDGISELSGMRDAVYGRRSSRAHHLCELTARAPAPSRVAAGIAGKKHLHDARANLACCGTHKIVRPVGKRIGVPAIARESTGQIFELQSGVHAVDPRARRIFGAATAAYTQGVRCEKD